MTDPALAETLRALLKKATPGPWLKHPARQDNYRAGIHSVRDEDGERVFLHVAWMDDEYSDADADLICVLVNHAAQIAEALAPAPQEQEGTRE
jgi:hypothetical protein